MGDSIALERMRTTALLHAATVGEDATVRQLLSEPPPLPLASCRDADGFTPLMRAVAGGHVAIVNLLLTDKAHGAAPVRLQNKVRLLAVADTIARPLDRRRLSLRRRARRLFIMRVREATAPSRACSFSMAVT